MGGCASQGRLYHTLREGILFDMTRENWIRSQLRTPRAGPSKRVFSYSWLPSFSQPGWVHTSKTSTPNTGKTGRRTCSTLTCYPSQCSQFSHRLFTTNSLVCTPRSHLCFHRALQVHFRYQSTRSSPQLLSTLFTSLLMRSRNCFALLALTFSAQTHLQLLSRLC